MISLCYVHNNTIVADFFACLMFTTVVRYKNDYIPNNLKTAPKLREFTCSMIPKMLVELRSWKNDDKQNVSGVLCTTHYQYFSIKNKNDISRHK